MGGSRTARMGVLICVGGLMVVGEVLHPVPVGIGLVLGVVEVEFPVPFQFPESFESDPAG